MHNNLTENLESGDLKRLVSSEIHIDEYKSKMGDDADVCVVSFKVAGKEPSMDLVAFIEKGYDWVLDADVSSGEKEGGDYLVFVEMQRAEQVPEQISEMLADITNLTEHTVDDWTFKYRKSSVVQSATQENLTKAIPLTPDIYNQKYDQEQRDIDQLKTAAGIEVDTKAPVNDMTESLRIAAGIR